MRPATPTPDLLHPTGDDSLSALLDGELADERAGLALGRLRTDTAARDRYRDYCFIGDALRGLDRDAPDLTDRVLAALDQEPTVLAPLPRAPNRRPALWLAAAAMTALAWGLWNAGLREDTAPPLAAGPGAPLASAEPGNALSYLAAHQDFAQAVVAPSEMRFTRVSLAGTGQ